MVRRQLMDAVHLEPFDYVVQAMGAICGVILISLVKTDTRQYSWYTVFTPFFVANATSAYFHLIVFFRLRLVGRGREAGFKLCWIVLLLGLLSTFEALLAANLQGGNPSIGSSLSPMVLLLLAILGRFVAFKVHSVR